jgi:hypothetical protein
MPTSALCGEAKQHCALAVKQELKLDELLERNGSATLVKVERGNAFASLVEGNTETSGAILAACKVRFGDVEDGRFGGVVELPAEMACEPEPSNVASEFERHTIGVERVKTAMNDSFTFHEFLMGRSERPSQAKSAGVVTATRRETEDLSPNHLPELARLVRGQEEGRSRRPMKAKKRIMVRDGRDVSLEGSILDEKTKTKDRQIDRKHYLGRR